MKVVALPAGNSAEKIWMEKKQGLKISPKPLFLLVAVGGLAEKDPQILLSHRGINPFIAPVITAS
jgi:hypothetical protein